MMEYAQNIAKNSRSESAKRHTQTPTSVSSPTFQRVKNNTGLPDNLKAGIENLSGYSMDDVKVHYNSNKPSGLQAHAYAQGTDIHLSPGQERHLPHEAWHVVQQKQGRVRPTMQLKDKELMSSDNVVQRVYSNYMVNLPDEDSHRTQGLTINDDVDKQTVEDFVNKLERKQLYFFDSISDWMHENANKAVINDPFNEHIKNILWQCGSCKLGTTSFELGHITDWKKELKKAGVTNLEDAIIVYNNLYNLKPECPRCNSSHDWEQNEDGNFKDHVTQQDFIESRGDDTIKKAKIDHKKYMDNYDDKIEDEYAGSFIDDSLRENEAIYNPIYLLEIGGAMRFGTFKSTRVSFTGESHPFGLKVVMIEHTHDSNISIGETFYINETKSKKIQ